MLKPLMFVMLPVVVIIIQTGLRYEHRPLHPGETAIVKVKINNPSKFVDAGNGTLVLPKGLKVETPPLRVNEGEEIYWRIKAEKEGEFDLSFKAFDKEIKKRIVVGSNLTKISPKSFKEDWLKAFLYPGEPALASDLEIESFEVIYPYLNVSLFGWTAHWLVLFFILSLVFGFLLLKPFRVSV